MGVRNEMDLASGRPERTHGQQKGFLVFQLEVFVFKLLAVNGFPSSTIAIGKVTPLNHKLFNNTMKGGTLEMQRLSLGALALFSGTQRQKVLSRLGCNVHVQLHDNSSNIFSAVRDINCGKASKQNRQSSSV